MRIRFLIAALLACSGCSQDGASTAPSQVAPTQDAVREEAATNKLDYVQDAGGNRVCVKWSCKDVPRGGLDHTALDLVGTTWMSCNDIFYPGMNRIECSGLPLEAEEAKLGEKIRGESYFVSLITFNQGGTVSCAFASQERDDKTWVVEENHSKSESTYSALPGEMRIEDCDFRQAPNTFTIDTWSLELESTPLQRSTCVNRLMFGIAGGKTRFCLISPEKKAEILGWMEKLPALVVPPDENAYVAPTQEEQNQSSDDVLSAAMAASDGEAKELSAIFDEGSSSVPEAPTSAGPSFNCQKASTDVERMICSDETLSGLDRELSAKYSRLLRAGAVELKGSQLSWTKQRDTCTDKACVGLAYMTRIRELDKLLASN